MINPRRKLFNPYFDSKSLFPNLLLKPIFSIHILKIKDRIVRIKQHKLYSLLSTKK